MIHTSDGQSYEDEVDYHFDRPIDYQQSQETDKKNPDEPMKLYFVRHGDTMLNSETGENANDQPVRGWSNVPLNDEGLGHARKAAESVKDQDITHIVSSDLPRAKQTANIIGKKIGVTPMFDPGLRTWDLGAYTGQAGKEVRDKVNKLCMENQDEKPPSNDQYKGESFNEFKNRILGTVSNIVQEHQKHGDREVLVVSHNSPERVLHAWDEAGQPQKVMNG